ncbi:HYD1 signature containing ADP-ribosyltransferase family protein [Pseudomonas frederiksbergensis]|uniref:HYD1 signature containing ADP-ribosyltransferase family protein n=1 Tax=Pseudomonas frederiksbergensis TaxID=104087 RepID=UPI0035CCE0F1
MRNHTRRTTVEKRGTDLFLYTVSSCENKSVPFFSQDNNRVYVEPASKKAQNQLTAEEKYQIGRGRGRDYIETDVPKSQLEWVKNPRYGTMELTIKGNVKLENPTFMRRK